MKHNKIKRKIICVFTSLCVLFSACPVSAKANDVSQKKKAGQEYSKILQWYLEAYNNANNENYEKPEEVSYEFIEHMTYGEKSNVIYRIMDFNKDGIPELFVGLRDTGYYYPYKKSRCGYILYEAYTLRNGRVRRITGYMVGNRGSTWVFCKNGIIADGWNGGTSSHGVAFRKMPKSKTKLTSYITLSYEGDRKYMLIKKGKKTRIKEKKYNKLMKKYYKAKKVTFYKLTSTAVQNIENGKFVYSGQKKWKLRG